jgi:hypothetical protein
MSLKFDFLEGLPLPKFLISRNFLNFKLKNFLVLLMKAKAKRRNKNESRKKRKLLPVLSRLFLKSRINFALTYCFTGNLDEFNFNLYYFKNFKKIDPFFIVKYVLEKILYLFYII